MLTSCSSDSSDEEETTGGSGDSAQSEGAFPVTIESALGPATIEEQPERVVTLGQGSTETAIALGHTPVGIGVSGTFTDTRGIMNGTALVGKASQIFGATLHKLADID